MAAALIAGRDRQQSLAELTRVAELVPLPELLALVADVLIVIGEDHDRLKARVADLLAARFGRSSEQSSSEQIALFATVVQTLQQVPAEPDGPAGDDPPGPGEPPSEPPPPPPDIPSLLEQTEREIQERLELLRRERKVEQERRRQEAFAARQAGRAEGSGTWPQHLPVREETIDVDPDQRYCPDPDCGCEREVIGRETSWRVERKVEVDVVVTHQLVRACQAHHGGPVTAPAPPKPVDKGHLGFELAAHAIHLRFSHNLPIRRIVDMLADELVPVSEDMLQTLFDVTSQRIEPVLEALVRRVRSSKLVNVDDTPVLILDPASPDGRRTGRIWLALGDERYAWFFSTPNWKADEAEKRLGELCGTLQGDGYKAFKRMARKLGIRLAGCMAHLRRKLRRALLAKDPRAQEPLALVQGLYRIEKLARLQGLDADAIRALRQERAVPLMDALERWARTVAPTVERQSPLGKAWTYLDNQWDYLRTYLDDGHVSIDNNAAERCLRRITIGRKLWLFFRGDVTVERAARLASLLMTARLHGANERHYLAWLLREVARREWSVEAAARLLPDAWLATQQKQAEQGPGVQG